MIKEQRHIPCASRSRDTFMAGVTLFLLLHGSLARACPGCTLSRVEFSTPEIPYWSVIVPIWFAAQCVIITIFARWTKRSVAGAIGTIVFAFIFGQFLYADYWLAALWPFPLVCQLLSIKRYLTKQGSRRYLVLTQITGLLFIAILGGTLWSFRKQQQNIPLADRILQHGFRAGSIEALGSLRPGDPQAFEIRRQILRKGDIKKEGNGYLGGQALFMAKSADWLLEHGDIEEELPLILDCMERLDRRTKEFGVKGKLHHVGLRIPDLFHDRYSFSIDYDAPPAKIREAWKSILKKYAGLDPKIRKIMLAGGFTITFDLFDTKTQRAFSDAFGGYEIWGKDAQGNEIENLHIDGPPYKIEKVPSDMVSLHLDLDGYAPYETMLPKSNEKGIISLGKIPMVPR